MAIPSLADFRVRFPEFDDAPDAIVQACLSEAELQTPERVWLARQRDGILWLAAHLITIHPHAKEMRIDAVGHTLYQMRREELERIVYTGPMVVGLS